MEDSAYYKDGVARVIGLIKDTLGNDYTYFNGEPADIGESMLPCVIVSETSGSIASGATGTDDIVETIVIIVCLNKKDDLGASSDVKLTEFKLRKLVKGQHPTTMEYLPGTVMYAIRKHISMNESIIQSSIKTDFDTNQRGAAVFTQEAYIEVTLERLAFVPSRD